MPVEFREEPAVGRRGPGNFDTTAAMVTVDDFVDELLLRIDDILSNGDEADPGERGESELMPTIALLIAAMAESEECPVEPHEARAWRKAYLARFQASGRSLFPDQARFEQRLRVIVETFGRLEELACRFHPDLATQTPASALN